MGSEAMQDQDGDAVWFGDERVTRTEKAGRVRAVFDSVAGRYDLMNDLMSAGIHRLWKDTFVAMVNLRPGSHCLDVAGGTGDIAFRLHERLCRLAAKEKAAEAEAQGCPETAAPLATAPEPLQPAGRVMVSDINASMLQVGQDRAWNRGLVSGLEWLCADAETLPLPDRSVDVYTIAFGLRNVTDRGKALAEARRVLKPGGQFLCLEFSHVVLPLVDRFYAIYSDRLLPAMGRLVAGDAESYRYLVESIRRFPDQPALVQEMIGAGFGLVRFRNLSGGIAAIHYGWRL